MLTFQSSFEEWLGEDPNGRLLSQRLCYFYSYFKERGLTNWTVRNVLVLLLNLFNGLFLFFLVAFINWKGLSSCDSTTSCALVAFKPHPLTPFPFFSSFILLCYLSYWIRFFLIFLKDVPKMKQMKHFYNEVLCISESDLQVIPFSVVIDAVASEKVSAENPGLVAYKLAQLICRDDNTLLALFHSGVIPLDKELFSIGPIKIDYFSKSMEFLLRKIFVESVWKNSIIDNKLFQSKFHLSHEILRQNIFKWGIISFIFSPIIALFIIIHLFFTYTEALYDKSADATLKSWSNRAKWTFKHFNEFSHDFDEKLRLAYSPAKEYLSLFQSRLTVLISRFILYICSSISAVIIISIYLYGENVVGMNVFGLTGRSYLWLLLSVLIPLITLARGSIPTPDFTFHAHQSLRKLFTATKYLPDAWRGKAESIYTKKALGSLFSMRLTQLISEIVSVIINPFILIFHFLPRSAAMVNFFDEIIEHDSELSEGSDDIKWCQFQINKEGKVDVTFPVHRGPDNVSTVRNKIISSILLFAANWPNWNPQNFDKFLENFPRKNPDVIQGAFDVLASQNLSATSLVQNYHVNNQLQSILTNNADFSRANLSTLSITQRSALYSFLHDAAIVEESKSTIKSTAQPIKNDSFFEETWSPRVEEKRLLTEFNWTG
ncbi:hypothetical protein RCL1_005175 [Eukaryota sp. TZLM3-RCL]